MAGGPVTTMAAGQPLHVDHLPDICVCRWTSPSDEPGWTLQERHPGCWSAVHHDPPVLT